MRKSRPQLLASLHQIHEERRRLIRRLKQEHELAIGTVSVVNRKCGNPSCHCVEGPGHPQTLFLFKDETEGRRRCKLVRRADEAWMLRAGERYREFREDMKQLRAIDLEEKQILVALAEVRGIRYE
jgi:Family of unknown function (DUF6788)